MSTVRILRRGAGWWGVAGLALLLPGGCAAPTGTEARESGAPVVTETVTPIAGSLPAGGAEPMRVQRSYFAASGRECREVVLGFGAGERASVMCQDGAGGWAPARPLLRGGGAALASGTARP